MINTIFFTTICFIIGIYIGYTFASYIDNKYMKKDILEVIRTKDISIYYQKGEIYSIVDIVHRLTNETIYIGYNNKTGLYSLDYVKQGKSKKCDKGR